MGANAVIAEARQQGRTLLTEVEAKDVVREAGIPVVETRLARSKAQAMAMAKSLGFPVALKIASPDISHKSDIGGVKLGLASASAVGRAYDEIQAAAEKASPSAHIHGLSVQPMAKAGVEVILGVSKDPQFGAVIMFGLGGVLVEVLKDVSFRVVPLRPRDAAQMVREIKGFPVLEGYRGQAPADVGAIEGAILKLSDFVERHPEIRELDLNPVFAYSRGLVAVDARIVLEATA